MAKSRREFLTHASLGVAGAIVGGEVLAESQPSTQEPTPGAPPAFGTGPAVGPEVSPTTFAEAEKLVQVQLSSAERAAAWAAQSKFGCAAWALVSLQLCSSGPAGGPTARWIRA